MELSITSSAFKNNGKIPPKYTCDGEKVSPPLEISGISPEAKSLVLIMEDPDVPKNVRADGVWDHWIRFNLPPTLAAVNEGEDPGGLAGINTSKNFKYTPPCPPSGKHRYFFKLYSLNIDLPLNEGATKLEIESAMREHIIQEATLVGTYKRQ